MVWEQRSCIIVMLTSLFEKDRKKADAYWPDNIGQSTIYGDFVVTYLNCNVDYKNINIRTFQLSQLNAEREVISSRSVHQLHYTEWSDMGTPTTSGLLNLIRLTNICSSVCSSKGYDGPIIAHCSAGVGRAGTFLAVAASQQLVNNNMSVNVPILVARLRFQRFGSVQTKQQYSFIYSALQAITKTN